MVIEERCELAAFLRTLSDEQWLGPTLCEQWQVRDVLAHLLHDSLRVLRYPGTLLRARFRLDRTSDLMVQHYRRFSPAELLDIFERGIGRGPAILLAPHVSLSHTVVHHQDIRRPLNRLRQIDTARLLEVLGHPEPFARPRRFTHGLRFVASDVGFVAGDGPEVYGPGEALVMAMVGRPSVLAELTGPGVALLRARVTALSRG